jgi:hypothetical protein
LLAIFFCFEIIFFLATFYFLWVFDLATFLSICDTFSVTA